MTKSAAIAAVALLCASMSRVYAGTFWLNADDAVYFGLANTNALPVGDAVYMGQFSISDGAISAMASGGRISEANYYALVSAFVPLNGTSLNTIGTNALGYAGAIGAMYTGNNTLFTSRAIYLMVVNAATTAGATQVGVFRGDTSWYYPGDMLGGAQAIDTDDALTTPLLGSYLASVSSSVYGYGYDCGAAQCYGTISVLALDTVILGPSTWVNPASGKWETGGNWSYGLPSIADPADLITNANSKTVTIDAVTTNTPSALSINNLTVSAPLGSTNTLFLNDASTATPLSILNALIIGTNGAVVVNQSTVQAFSNILVGVAGGTGALFITNSSAVSVTNASGKAVLEVQSGMLSLNGGTVTVNQLVLTNGANSVFTFNAGTFISGGTFVTNGQSFVFGDGTDAATFQLNGGMHSFANNLEISNNATLSGCGTVTGNVAVDPGGTVLANCGGTLNFTGIVTNNGNIYVLNGTSLNFCGPVVNNGLIEPRNAHLQFWSGVQNNGTIEPDAVATLSISSVTRQGNDIRVAWTCVSGNSYALQSTKAAAIAGYTTNFANISPIIIASGNGNSLGVTNYLDVGAAYAPVLAAPGGTMVTTSVVPSTVSISAAGTRGIADSLSQALPGGSLLMLGTFSISEATIQSNFYAGNVSAIMSAFTPYSTSFKVGDGTGLAASWSVSESAAGFGGQQIYLLAVDTPTLAKANHLGIYTAPSWVFPDDGNEIDIDLSDVTDFVIGAQGGSLTINLPVGGQTYTFDDTARLSVLPGRILFYRVRLVP